MRNFICAIAIVLVGSAVLAGAEYDLRVESKKDSKGHTLYEITNAGTRNIKARVQHKKNCSSTTTQQEPVEREYWISPGDSKRLRKVMSGSDCRYTFRIVRAEYY